MATPTLRETRRPDGTLPSCGNFSAIDNVFSEKEVGLMTRRLLLAILAFFILPFMAFSAEEATNMFRIRIAKGIVTGTEEYRLEKVQEGYRLTSKMHLEQAGSSTTASALLAPYRAPGPAPAARLPYHDHNPFPEARHRTGGEVGDVCTSAGTGLAVGFSRVGEPSR